LETDVRLAHEVNPMRKRHSDLKVVFHQKDRNAEVIDLSQHVADFLDHDWSKALSWFIH
jgi:hypothetical protein